MADFIRCNADLHLHGLYSGAVSSSMVPKTIAEQAPLKGLHLLGTADILNARWVKLVKEQLKDAGEGILEHDNGTKFILQTEVEDNNRVHHVILFPDFSKVEEVKEKLKSKCKDFDTDGRPKIWLNGEQIAEICVDSGCLIGFAHAFTPYFGIYSKFDSYKDCYGDLWKKIYFLELGLSADTNMADRISELHNLTFTSNSDCHSPWPNKMGREFNTFRVKETTFDEIAKALKREDGRGSALNVGFNPLEGKYHKTRCTGCLTFFEPKEAMKLNWRCPQCRKSIKKGVDFRIEELANLNKDAHPNHRPAYKHIIPLSEIIALALNTNNAMSNKVQDIWKRFVSRFGSEIRVLLNAKHEELEKVNPSIAEYIQYFREDKINYIPGGAGVYGQLVPPNKTMEKLKTYNTSQKSLSDF
ncbi:TIGR00375 family protein [Candidatus Woesearchaeota archaeon]|nr:TIGR00375 family protein [Candidatus Woesearchaeota archaeon]|tara:strand:- start:8149 stop:9390 length:1242 start_codon:yes stop_codon:yes gene_type:complete